MPHRIYLDHAATTPMLPEAIEAVADGMRVWANASSPHAEGRAARAAIEQSRARIKAALAWDGELIFTSGASEALAIALARSRGGRRWRSPVEHDAVLRAAPNAGVLRLDPYQNLDPESVGEALAAGDRPVFAVQHVNSETGRIQFPHEQVRRIAEAGGTLIVDAAQSGGKRALPRADMVVVSAHKLGGPAGIGALLVRDFELLEPVGGQEYGYRPGTENMPAILGFAAAAEVAVREIDRVDPLLDAIRELHAAIRAGGGRIVGGYGEFTGRILAIHMPHLAASAQLVRFDMMGFAVSAGSACASGTLKPSRVLRAYGVPDDIAQSTIRVSFGWSTTPAEIAAFAEAWGIVAHDASARAA